jgi:hypothetical protein
MADLEIDVPALKGKSSELSSLKSKATSTYDKCIGSYLCTVGEPISGLKEIVKAPMERFKNGYGQSDTWFSNYLSDLESVESGLESFKGTNVTAPTSFSGKFEDIFGKVTMPVLKTNGDKEANYKIFGGGTVDTSEIDATTGASQAGLNIDENNGSTVNIPDSIAQRPYTVTCYGVGGWHLSGKAQATKIASGTGQDKVHQKWVQDGARYKNGIAVMNINGVDHYLVAVAPTFGKSGRVLKVKLKNGQEIPCVVADSKSTHDSNYTKYGHSNKKGAVNVLEFEVDRTWYNSKHTPGSSKWPMSWDSSSKVSSITTYGSVI